MSYTYLHLAQEVLHNSATPLQLGQIWNLAKQKGLDKKLESENPRKSVLATALHSPTRREAYNIFAFSKSPTLFGIIGKHQAIIPEVVNDPQENEIDKTSKEQLERSLHPLFVKFARDELNLFCKTIFHEKSQKREKGINEWIHPDIVGVKFSIQDFKESKCQREMLEFIHTFNYPKIELYSFELKVEIKSADLKKIYFQAVSNSSWANYGYLAVFRPIEPSIKDELRKLNARFGIGVINFGTDNEEWEILFPAKRRENIDVSMLDELSRINDDFKKLLDDIIKDTKGKREEPVPQDYDTYLSDADREEYVKEYDMKTKRDL